MTYEQYEDIIVGMLAIDGVETSVLPFVEKLNMPRQSQTPQLFVLVNGGSFADAEYLDMTAQIETISCEAFIWAVKRRGELGVFAIADEVRKRLLGTKLPHCKDAITLKSFEYVSGNNNNWMYSLSFDFTRVVVQEELPTDTTYPADTITQVNTTYRNCYDELL